VKHNRYGVKLTWSPFKRNLITLDIEATEARLVVFQGKAITWWGSIALPAGTMRNGVVVQPDVFGRALAGLFAQARAARRGVIVSLGGQRALVRMLSLPPIEAKLLAETVRREARRELPLPLDELYLSWQVVGDHTAARVQVFTLGVPREMLDACVTGLRAGNIQPGAMDLKPLALARAVNLPDVLIVDVEASTQDLVLVREKTPIIVRSIGAAARMASDGRAVADALAGEVQRTLDFHSSVAAARGAWAPMVCLTGQLATDTAIRQRLASWTLVEPALPVTVPPDFPTLTYLTNIGLGLKQR
jgi:hypothetical protein